MDHSEKVFIGLLAAAVIGLAWYLATRPTQIDISPKPSAPLPDDVVNESERPPSKASTPDVSAYSGMFLYPLSFARPMPITSTRMQ